MSKKKKIRLYLSGGIGNQLFQYATAMMFAKNFNREIIIDISFYKYKINKTVERDFQIYDFPISSHKIESNYLLFKFISLLSTRSIKTLSKIIGITSLKTPFIYEDLSDNVNYLYGYFQNTKFFNDIHYELKKTFGSLRVSSDTCKVITNEITTTLNPVCIHIRRGDYLLATATSGYYALDKSYFLNSINKIKSLNESLNFYIFSDDIDWCTREFNWLSNVYFVSPDEYSASETLYLMSLCKHFIISNSTFSWWAAYLGQKNNGTIIMPLMWQSGIHTKKAGLFIENAILI